MEETSNKTATQKVERNEAEQEAIDTLVQPECWSQQHLGGDSDAGTQPAMGPYSTLQGADGPWRDVVWQLNG